ncbi:hypothetical protein [Nostoc sp. TCL26-01]|uniref:hypothetical protein n=1 Tax=Nostoc sp. TCL26-01 TaxID=2576904 RepID=UPI0015C176E6|nr:hypothetical protein [Nostoc sp. TCL26-01]QLE58171.1 cupin domain-containing protein [Nostoc sp. TCL26-01]
MKLFGVGLISSLLLTLTSNASVEAFVFPNITPDTDAPTYLFLPNQTMTFLKRGETTKGRYALAELELQPGVGVLPNIHQFENEWIYIKEGNPRLFLGDSLYTDPSQIPGINAPRDRIQAFDATPGTLFYGQQHRIRGGINLGDTPVKVLLVWSPSGFENLFKEVSPVVQDPSNPPPYTPEIFSAFISTAPKYGLISSSFLEEFGDIEFSESFPNLDDHADELLSILNEDITQVPESSSGWSLLTFGVLAAISILQRKYRAELFGAKL